MTDLVPTSEQEIAEIVRSGAPVRVRGNGTRRGLGRPVEAHTTLSLSAHSGVVLYEPAEMVMSVRAGTPVALIKQILAEKKQMLPFEPADHRLLYGTTGEPTFGAVAACNISGPRRIQAGAARDSIIGVRFVNGSGEVIKSGGRVMKNVTGLDLVKLSCGAYGSLGILSEITFKVLPRPEHSATLVLEGLNDADAVAALTQAMGSPYEISGAAHLPGRGDAPPQTLLRLEGFVPSVEERLELVRGLFAAKAPAHVLAGDESAARWSYIRDAGPVAEPFEHAIWRISVRPTDGSRFVSAVADIGIAAHFYDWSGGLVWLAVSEHADAGAATIRAALATLGGHATLMRGSDELRRATHVFQPLDPALRALTERIKRSVDPKRILNPSIMYEGI